MNPSFRTAAVAVMVLALATGACGKKKPDVKPAPQPPPVEKPATTPPAPPAPTPPPPPTPTPPPTEDEIWAKMTPEEATKAGFLKPVYFALDSTVISEEARGILQKNVDFLKKRSSAKILIEGHADSRGTNEYNLALGERRADAVRDYVVSLGVATDRVTIVSKGEEQPFCKEETESCWQQNRVGYFIFTATK